MLTSVDQLYFRPESLHSHLLEVQRAGERSDAAHTRLTFILIRKQDKMFFTVEVKQ